MLNVIDISIEKEHNASFGYISSLTAIFDIKFNDENLLSIKKNKADAVIGSLVDCVSGESFRFTYSKEKRFESAFVYLKNPLVTAATSFGYSYYYVFNISVADFHKMVTEQLKVDVPVITTYPMTKSLSEWGIIKDLTTENITIATFTGEKQFDFKNHIDYLKKTLWYTLDNKEPIKAKSHIFFISKKRYDVEIDSLFESAIKRAKFLFYIPKITFDDITFSAGKEAIYEIIDDLHKERDYRKLKKEDLHVISMWNGIPFMYFWRKLESINNFVQILQSYYSGKEQKYVEKALISSEDALKNAYLYQSALSFEKIQDNILGNENDLIKKFLDSERREAGINALQNIENALSDTLMYMEDII